MTVIDRNSTLRTRLRLEGGVLMRVIGLLLVTFATQLLQAQAFTVLYSFSGGADGGYPYGVLLRDSSGKLYGTTYGGGASNYGTVFELDLADRETVLHSFTGPPDGAYPYAGLIRDSQGNLYGTTYLGGIPNDCYPRYLGCGTVFKVDSNDEETVLYSFCSEQYCNDGAKPVTGLIRDTAGALYGIAGVVFRLDPTGKETIIYSFGFFDGYPGYATLVRDAAGNFYDTTVYGGSGVCSFFYNVDCGLVFQLTPTGDFTALYSFTGTPDGQFPYAGLLAGEHGQFTVRPPREVPMTPGRCSSWGKMGRRPCCTASRGVARTEQIRLRV